jgi:hypothetical protein
MERINPWPLLRGEKEQREEGMRLVQQTYYNQPNSPPHIMQMGIALLWLEKYNEAWRHFRSKIESNPFMSGDGDYGMAGVAKWCLGKPHEAVLEWRAGLKAKYARASGLGIRVPLLLFFTAVRRPNVFDKGEAKKLIREKLGDIRIRNWPGPIARLVLDQISQAEFENHCRGIKPGDTDKNPFLRHSPEETGNCLWLAEFYRSVLGLEDGTLLDFQNSMGRLSDTSQSEWQDEDIFVSRLWHEEFFLARYEATSHDI